MEGSEEFGICQMEGGVLSFGGERSVQGDHLTFVR